MQVERKARERTLLFHEDWKGNREIPSNNQVINGNSLYKAHINTWL